MKHNPRLRFCLALPTEPTFGLLSQPSQSSSRWSATEGTAGNGLLTWVVRFLASDPSPGLRVALSDGF